MQPPEPASSHPVDALIVRLVRDHQTVATPDDVAAIVERIATAPFSRRLVRVPVRVRGLTYGDIVVERLTDALNYHLVKRVRIDFQWAEGTTAAQLLRDLRAAAQSPQASLLVYARSGDICAATMTPTRRVVPLHRLGPESLPNLLVVYSALQGTLVTGHMFSTIERVNLPEAIRWLR